MDSTATESDPLVKAEAFSSKDHDNGGAQSEDLNNTIPSYQKDRLLAPAAGAGVEHPSGLTSWLRKSVGIGIACLVALVLILLQVHKSQLLHHTIPDEDLDDDYVIHRRRRHPHHPYALVVEHLVQLDQQLEGTIYMRNDDMNQSTAFTSAATVWNLYATQHPPYAVIQVQNERDVQRALPVLSHLYRVYGVPFRVRSGGHHKAGYSSVEDGIVLSLVRMNTVKLEQLPNATSSTSNSSSAPLTNTAIATFGPAARVKDVIVQTLRPYGYAGVVGACGTVAESGFILGGGFGFQSRYRGLGADNVVSMRVVLANGTVLDVGSNHRDHSDEENDLFWALRGAGGGNFGVVTQLRYQLHKTLDTQVAAQVVLSYHDLAAVMHLLGQLSRNPLLLPSQICVMLDERHDQQHLGLNFLWFSVEEQRQLSLVMKDMKESIDAIFHQAIPTVHYNLTVQTFSWTASVDFMQNISYFSAWDNPYAQAWCGYLFQDNNTLPVWTDMMKQLSNILELSPYLYPDVELYGGAIAQLPWNATAFPHRQAVYNVGVLLMVPKDNDDQDDEDSHEQLELFHKIVAKVNALWPNVSQYLTGTYVNYPMASLGRDEYARAYWGDNLERLVRVKQRFDPMNVFAFEQSVPMHL